MCHPWLAAGAIAFIVAQIHREIGPVLRGDVPADADAASGLLGNGVRRWFRQRLEPLVDSLLAVGITANGVTALQLAVSVLCGVAYAAGWIFTAGWLLIASGTLDVVDGEIARRGGSAGRRGAFIDSVVDRYGEFAVCLGLLALFRGGWPMWVVVVGFFGGFMVSYTRARAEGLGIDCRLGMMQRPERYVVLGFGSMVGTLLAHLVCMPALSERILLASVALVAVLANSTAVQRAIFAVRRFA